MKIISTMVVLLAMILTSLPLAVSAQTRTRYSGGHAVGTSEYYNDDTVILRSRKSFINSVDIHIGRSPEVPGGLKTAPAADEEDVPLEKRILVATRTSLGNIYIGYLNPIVNGKQIIVRRKKASKKIIVVINCGNWTRELAADYSFVCDTTPGLCVPGKVDTNREEYISEDGKTKTVIVTTSDGCKTRIEKTVTIVETKYRCEPGILDPTPLYETASGKLGKAFKVAEVTSHLSQEIRVGAIAHLPEKVNALIIYQEACPVDENKRMIKVHYFTSSGGWSWVSFFVGAGIGFVIGFVVRGSGRPDKPVLIPPVTPTKTGNASRPTSTGVGGGPTSGGGTIGTRPRRP
ncbi:MAG TPA: hypothetical protein PKD79_03090 [Candidatus Doudnabacteria bacterium]|nr:hypothetical protein [Candidatus Doudnabacteria bacterium]